MPQVSCPKCSKVLKAPPAAVGKKVKCPNAECHHVFMIPPATTEAEGFSLAADPIASPAKETGRPVVRSQHVQESPPMHLGGSDPSVDAWSSFSEVDPDYEVLLPDGRVIGMTSETIRAALLKGKIDRFHRVRELDDLSRNAESAYGFTRKRRIVHPWVSLGATDAMEIPGSKQLYRSKIYSHDGIIKIVGIALFVLLGLGVLYSVFSLDVDGERVREVLRQESGGPFGVRLLRGGAMLVPEAYILVVQLVAAFLGLLFAAAVAIGVGWLSGLAFGVLWFLKYRQDSSGPPPDGYPGMFWKHGPHWLATRRAQ